MPAIVMAADPSACSEPEGSRDAGLLVLKLDSSQCIGTCCHLALAAQSHCLNSAISGFSVHCELGAAGPQQG